MGIKGGIRVRVRLRACVLSGQQGERIRAYSLEGCGVWRMNEWGRGWRGSRVDVFLVYHPPSKSLPPRTLMIRLSGSAKDVITNSQFPIGHSAR